MAIMKYFPHLPLIQSGPVYDIKGGWAGLVPSNGFNNPIAITQYRKGQQQ